MQENISNIGEDLPCAQYETYTITRFVLIATATGIACVGTAFNIILAYVFCTRKQSSSTPATLYPTVLAVLDLAICVEYILLFGVDAIVSFVRIESLFVLYYLYIIPAYVVSRITQLAIPYMLIFATLERLVWTCGKIRHPYLRAMYSTSGRHWTVIVTLAICVILRLSTAVAMEVAHYPQCTDFFRTMTTRTKLWVEASDVYYIFDFHIMTIAQTLVPFVALVVLNLIIVEKIGREGKAPTPPQTMLGPSPCPSPTRLHVNDESPKYRKISALGLTLPLKGLSASVRSAVFTMTAIVTSYLISNILHLILTYMERSNHPWLIDPDDHLKSSAFHTFFSDAVSFVYMFTSAIRLLIYYGCNPAIRKDIRAFISGTPDEVYL